MVFVLKMTSSLPENTKIVIRPVQYRDLEFIKTLAVNSCEAEQSSGLVALVRQLQQVRSRYGLLKFLSLFPNPHQYDFHVYVAEFAQEICGVIQVSPFNITRSTWRVEQVLVDTKTVQSQLVLGTVEIGSQLLRYCFETIWEARTWVLEVNINQKNTLALYRHNGFQPLAQLTYWAIAPELIEQLAQREPDLPNLLPVSNTDAQLLYQLDTVSMPPLLRQVFDRHIRDFKTTFLSSVLAKIMHWLGKKQVTQGYVFEPQRKAAIGYFHLDLCSDGSQPHQAQLTVHPAYTWLYPKLLSQMAQIVQSLPTQSLQLTSADYQPEREEFLENLGATRIEHTLLMSRSVWHKLRESKPREGLQLSEVLQGLKPARTPIPSRVSWLKPWTQQLQQKTSPPQDISKSSKSSKPLTSDNTPRGKPSETPNNGHHA